MERLTESIDPQEQIPVQWVPGDFDHARMELKMGRISHDQYLAALPQFTIDIITRAQITKFCGPCDYYGKSGLCERLELSDQTRYVAREWCGWASVNNEMVYMTASGPKAKNLP